MQVLSVFTISLFMAVFVCSEDIKKERALMKLDSVYLCVDICWLKRRITNSFASCEDSL